MNWIPITDRKPPRDGEQYFWRGKRCGGYAYFCNDGNNLDTHGFELGDVAVNHTASEYFEWLDESETTTVIVLSTIKQHGFYRGIDEEAKISMPKNKVVDYLSKKDKRRLFLHRKRNYQKNTKFC